MAALLEAHRVTKVYGKEPLAVRAVDGASLTVYEGDFFVIEGQSGSGKSTLLALLGALDRPTEGTVSLRGRTLNDLNDAELAEIRSREIGFVFQAFHLLPTLTARENVEAALAPRRLPHQARRERAMELLERVGLSARAEHLPNALSGGEQQRVAIARALANDPAVVLADEPTGNLDSKTGDEVVRLLADLSEGGKAVVIVTHAPDFRRYATRRGQMADGRLTWS